MNDWVQCSLAAVKARNIRETPFQKIVESWSQLFNEKLCTDAFLNELRSTCLQIQFEDSVSANTNGNISTGSISSTNAVHIQHLSNRLASFYSQSELCSSFDSPAAASHGPSFTAERLQLQLQQQQWKFPPTSTAPPPPPAGAGAGASASASANANPATVAVPLRSAFYERAQPNDGKTNIALAQKIRIASLEEDVQVLQNQLSQSSQQAKLQQAGREVMQRDLQLITAELLACRMSREQAEVCALLGLWVCGMCVCVCVVVVVVVVVRCTCVHVYMCMCMHVPRVDHFSPLTPRPLSSPPLLLLSSSPPALPCPAFSHGNRPRIKPASMTTGTCCANCCWQRAQQRRSSTT